MGKSGSGKTSMRSIIFANYLARDTAKLTPTWLFENTDIKFLGNLVLNLWDCGGQDSFMEKYFESQRDQIFRNVEVLIYVFDVESPEREKDLQYFKRCLSAVQENSKECQIFCLIHKMDTIGEDRRLQVFTERAGELTALAEQGLQITCFGTSIWDETLYKAWSAIVYSLIPNVEQIQTPLAKLCRLCQAQEVVVFEKATFLVISCAEQIESESDQNNDNNNDNNNNNNNNNSQNLIPDAHRHEKTSTVIKQFKLACLKSQTQFQSMQIKTRHFSAFIDVLTPTTYILVITRDQRILSSALQLSIQASRAVFEQFFPQ
jgi:Ras-related GTP-binding protein A/B